MYPDIVLYARSMALLFTRYDVMDELIIYLRISYS